MRVIKFVVLAWRGRKYSRRRSRKGRMASGGGVWRRAGEAGERQEEGAGEAVKA
jgi:hypothetical protein